MTSLHLNPALIRWIGNYMINHCQRAVVDGVMSQIIPVISGVHQGSVHITFSDIHRQCTKIHLSRGTKLTLYTNDLLVYKQIYFYDDYTEVQSDINLIYNWTSASILNANRW